MRLPRRGRAWVCASVEGGTCAVMELNNVYVVSYKPADRALSMFSRI